MPSVHLRADPLSDRRRSHLLFSGDLIVFRQVQALEAMRVHAEEVFRDVVGKRDADPGAIEDVRDAFREHARTVPLFVDTLAEVGVDVALAYWDRPVLRTVPPDNRPAGHGTGTLDLHRDTWGSNVLEQTNWWAPLRPVTRDRTLAFHLGHWDRPVSNDSADWDLGAVRNARRRGTEVQLVPEPTQPPDPGGELRLVVEPGDLVCFSGAQLHGSVPNTTARIRLSIEIRTVHLDDLRKGRRAPDVDGAAPHPPAWDWFRGITDGARLSEDVNDASVARPS